MSEFKDFTMIPNEAIRRMVVDNLSAGAFKLYLYLLYRRSQKTGQCNPSASTCAKDLDMQPRHIVKLRRELEDRRWAQFDNGAATILLDLTPVENDPLSKKTVPPVKKDSTPCQKNTSPPVIFVPPCEEEQNVEQNEKNKTNRTRRVGADAPRTVSTLDSDSFSGTLNKSVSAKGVKKTRGRAQRQSASPFHDHPAVVAYRDITEFNAIKAVQAEQIAQAIGLEVTEAPEDWRQFLRELAGTGNKYVYDVALMVSAFGFYRSGARLAEALDLAWTDRKGANYVNKTHTRKTAADNHRESYEWAYGDSAGV